jgi:hypothetical protein
MRAICRSGLLFITCLALVTAGSLAFAGVDRFGFIFFDDDKIRGKYTFGITTSEPYSHINADCETLKMVVGGPQQLAFEPIDSFEIGHPRSEYKEWDWDTTYLGAPVEDQLYCQYMGYSGLSEYPKIDLGHHDPNGENTTIDGDTDCKTPPPKIKTYFGLYCIGPFVYMVSVASIDPNIHKSYQYVSGNPICWEVAVEGSH